jgi:serine/threonine protein kinase
MIDERDCADIALESLFDESPGLAADAARLHVEHCDACRHRLEELAASDEWWDSCRANLSDWVLTDGQCVPPVECGWTALLQSDMPGYHDMLAAPSHPELLGRIGRYDVERVLGHGGMGMVFKAFDAELNRPVAIKVLASHLAGNGTARQRFGREARAAAAVVHEHVVSIHDVQTTESLPFLVMQYVPGESLQAWIDHHGPLEVRDIVRVGHQIAAGLAAAHEQGVVHRDIKPGNILLENGLGRVVITDFGLAQAADECSLTRTGTLAGTPHYMSPEQANAAPVDHRTDLFSLGSVLYVMATGRTPFRGARAMAVLHSICHDRPQPVREVNADIPLPLAELIDSLHAKDPRQRMQSAAEVRDALLAYLAHLQQPTLVRLPKALGRLRLRARWRRLRPVAGLGLGCLVIGTAALLMRHPAGTTQEGNVPVVKPDSATSSAVSSTTNLLSLMEVDEQLQAAAREIDALERTATAVRAVPADGVRWDEQLIEVESRMRRLESASF